MSSALPQVRSHEKNAPDDGNELLPVSYLMSASRESLLGFEQSRLNYVANLRKEIAAMQRQCDREQAAADVTRWLINNREEILRMAGDWLKRTLDRREGAA